MTDNGFEHACKAHQEMWNRRVSMIGKRSERKKDTFEDTAEWYTAYLCGVIDTLAVFSDVSYAIDAKEVIKGAVESIIKDAWLLEQ